ncbi:hypothetical protein [Flavobacterium tibetense]|uniref:Uncharacterized protein n=1 Tax=Flavobacterium tibetense TaxID=2233533 RepID=A0A365P283_9FLAO|nr:hypothetical protein [Flavobacterium tibetense]RBA28610.1 hypothetical protein DPN68_06240 [Flavobacterium tibetense]
MIKKTNLFFCFIFVLCCYFISCNEDNLHEHNHNVKAGIKTTKISYTEFKKHIKAFTVVADVNKQKSSSKLSKIVKDTINGFTIDTREGLYIQYANLHSFTFPIYRDEATELLENLVLSYQNDGSYKVKILQYRLTPYEKVSLQNGQLKSIQNPIETIFLDNFDNNLVTQSCGYTTETIWVSCGSGEHNSTNIESWGSCNSNTPPRVYTVTKPIKCIDEGGSGSGGSNDDSIGSGSTSGGGGGGSLGDSDYPPEYPTIETDPEEYELGISSPVLSIDKPISAPCNELSKLVTNNSIQQTLRILKGQSSGTSERGNYISETTNSLGATYLTFPVIPQNQNKPYEIDISAGLATGNVKGAMHCHTNPATTSMFPMFSAGDLMALYNIAYEHVPANNSVKDYAEYTVMLSVGSGHYALKFKNFSGDYISKLNTNFSNFQKDLETENINIGHLANSNLLIKTFLKNMNKYFGDEIGLYKATESIDSNGLPIITGWKEQTINSNGNVDEINCK